MDAVMQEYTEFLNTKRKNFGDNVVRWISEAKNDVKEDLDAIRKEYKKWREVDSRLFRQGGEGLNMAQVRLAKVEDMIFEVETQLDDLTGEIVVYKDSIDHGVDPEALLMMARDTGIRNWSEQDEIERQLQRAQDQKDLRVEGALMEDAERALRYGPDHPVRKALERQMKLAVALYEEKITTLGEAEDEEESHADRTQQLVDAYVKSMEARVRKGESSLKSLLERKVKLSGEANALLEDEDKQLYYDSEIARLEATYDGILEKIKEIDLVEAYGGDQKYRIERLQDPALGLKTDPTLAKSLAAGTMLGFLAGFGLGYLVEMFDKTFRSPQEVSEMLQLPMIGHIPEIVPTPVEDSKLSDTLIAAHKPKSPLAESFRAIRTALYFSTAGQQNRVIQTTSPVPGDGKSTLTANLAITIAQSNKSVLLVDGDFRRPTMHKMFGASNETGLASVVVGQADPLEAAQQTEVPNLYLMACGPRPHNPSELFDIGSIRRPN